MDVPNDIFVLCALCLDKLVDENVPVQHTEHVNMTLRPKAPKKPSYRCCKREAGVALCKMECIGCGQHGQQLPLLRLVVQHRDLSPV